MRRDSVNPATAAAAAGKVLVVYAVVLLSLAVATSTTASLEEGMLPHKCIRSRTRPVDTFWTHTEIFSHYLGFIVGS